MSAASEAASWLRFAEAGYKSRYGSVPLETRIELAKCWIDLARIEALSAPTEPTESNVTNQA